MKINLSRFWKLFGIPEPVREFQFHPARRWRADYAWPDRKLLVEIEGGVFGSKTQKYGWHQSVQRMLTDMEKYNNAELMGYHILRFTPEQFRDGTAAEILSRYFGRKEAVNQ